MHTLAILFFSSLASFIGSLQLGPVNLFVIDTTININKQSAYWIAIGGIFPEFIYCFLAVYVGSYFFNFPIVLIVFKILLIVILLVIGVIYLFKNHKSLPLKSHIKDINSSKMSYFLKGFTLASLNPQLLPYWMFTMVYFNSVKFLELKSEFDKLAYILGAGFGALFLLTSIIVTINQFKTRILTYLNSKYYYKALGIMFIAISIQQLITLL